MYKSARKSVLRVWFWRMLILVVVCISVLTFLVNPIIVNYSQAKIEAMTIKAVNRAVSSIINMDIYNELVDIKYDNAGKITSISTNMAKMNGLSSDIALASQNYVDLFATQGISVAVGTFSGLPVLTGKGPSVNLRVVPVGSINCSFASDFLGMGINQTRHRIVLMVNSIVDLIMPLTTRRVTAQIEVMLCESIIVGEVPEFLFTNNH